MQEQKPTEEQAKVRIADPAVNPAKFEEGLNRKTRREFEKFKKQLIRQNISPNAAYPMSQFDEAAWEEMKRKEKSAEEQKFMPDTTLGELKCKQLAKWAWMLSSYPFNFFLSTLWVAHHDCAPIEFWIDMFSSKKATDRASLMKPKEYGVWLNLPDVVTCYRAHRPGEEKWIAYTTQLDVAKLFAKINGATEVFEYEIPKQAIHAYFNRREEDEIIVTDMTQAQKVETHPL